MASRLRLLVLIILQILWLKTSHSQQTPSPSIFNEEASKQADIYRSRGVAIPEGYVIDRSLLSYVLVLPSEFKGSVANLASTDRWLDIGAGEGRAILDYSTSKYDVMLRGPRRADEKANAVAISIEDRRTIYWHQTAANLPPRQIQYLFGKPLSQYSSDELGQFEIITDVVGGFSYTRNLSLFMEKALGFLALNGSFYTLLQDVRSENGTNRPFYPNASFLTEIADAAGAEIKICSWLKRITCVEVTCELKDGLSPPIEVYSIRKVCNDVTVPSLVPIHFEAGTPPERRFQLRARSP